MEKLIDSHGIGQAHRNYRPTTGVGDFTVYLGIIFIFKNDTKRG